MQRIKIDFDNPGLPKRLDVMENDAQSRFFEAELYQGGKAYSAPSGATYSIMYHGFGPQNEGWYDTINDGAGKRAACTVSGNVVTCEIARQALQVPGHMTVILCVTASNGYMLKGWPITANVRNDDYNDGEEVEMYFNLSGNVSNSIDQLKKAIAEAEQARKDIETKAAEALASIPEDYTELDSNVKQIKEDLVNTVGYKGTIQSHSYSDVNDVKVNGVYVVDNYIGISNLPLYGSTETPQTGALIVMANNNYGGKYRLIQMFLGNDTKLHYRYCWNNTWSAWDVFAYATDIKKLQDYFNNELSSFEKYGKCSDVIKNVKVFGMEDNTRIIISNIRHNYVETSGQTVNACTVYMSDNSGSAGSKIHQITFSEENGHISKFSIPKISENAMISFDYKLSEIKDGSRVVGSGVEFLVKKSCYFPRIIEYSKIEECENLMTSFSMFEKFAVIGDSYSSGEIYVPKGDGTYRVKDYYELSWCQMLARRNGISCINMSSGGLHTRSWLTAQRGLSLLQSSEPQNLYIVALGINDVNKLGESYIGAISDIHDGNPSQNADSFYGNYGRIIEAIKEKSPLAKIIVFRCKKDTGVYAKYNIAISAIGKHYNLPAINQNDDAFFESSVYSTMVQGHPTAMGYSGMSLAFERLIDRCMRNNIDYFKDYDGLTSLS